MISEDTSLCALPGQFSKSHHECFQGQKHPRELSRCSAMRTLVDAENSNQNAHRLLPLSKVCLNMFPWSLTSAAYSKEPCIWTSTATCPSSFEVLMQSISLTSIKAVLLFCLDVGKDSDDNDVDENVRTPTTVSALRDKPSPSNYRNVPLLKSLDTGEETIWRIGVSNFFAG